MSDLELLLEVFALLLVSLSVTLLVLGVDVSLVGVGTCELAMAVVDALIGADRVEWRKANRCDIGFASAQRQTIRIIRPRMLRVG